MPSHIPPTSNTRIHQIVSVRPLAERYIYVRTPAPRGDKLTKSVFAAQTHRAPPPPDRPHFARFWHDAACLLCVLQKIMKFPAPSPRAPYLRNASRIISLACLCAGSTSAIFRSSACLRVIVVEVAGVWRHDTTRYVCVRVRVSRMHGAR